MKKQKIYIIIGIIGYIIMIILLKKQPSELMSVRYYDENKNLISKTYSIVDGIPNITFIDFTIQVQNTGGNTLNCNIINAKPSQLDTALVKTTRVIAQSGKSSWTSSLVNITPFQSPPGLKNFNATIECNYNNGQQLVYLPTKLANISIDIGS